VIGGVAMWAYTGTLDSSAVEIQKGTITGKQRLTSTASLPRSSNESQGATFSFECWFEVNDFTYGYGHRRCIFSRGDTPGVYLDSTSNSLIILVKTYGATDSVMIENIPIQKWVHLAIVVTQYTVDVYVNGMIRQHHTLSQLPKQEDAATQVSDNTGFDGQIAGLTYYSRALSPIEITAHAASTPQSLITAPQGGQYLDLTWYTGR